MLRTLLVATFASSALVLAGCQNGEKTEEPAESQPEVSMGAINDTCPVMEGSDVDPDGSTVSYEGYEIGFCCPGCVKGWEKMSDDEKQAFVAKNAGT